MLTRARLVAATVACLSWMVAFCFVIAVFGGTAMLFGVRHFGGLWFLAFVLGVGATCCLLSIWAYGRVVSRQSNGSSEQ